MALESDFTLKLPLRAIWFTEEVLPDPDTLFVVQVRRVGAALYKNHAFVWTQTEADFILAGALRLNNTTVNPDWEGRILTLDLQP